MLKKKSMNSSIESFALMDTKQQHSKNTKKKRFKSKRKDNETEVFVIPPDLLQKLGINLGNVQSTQECSITEVSSDTSGFKNQLNTPVKNVTSSNDLKTPEDCEKETSILETANLMTKSVFLSPTFTPVCANIIPGEFEISNAIWTEKNGIGAMHKSNNELNTNILKQQDALIPNIEPIKKIADSAQLPQDILENHAEELSIAKTEYNSENDLVATPLQENHKGFSNDVSRNINTDVIKKTDRKISTDDHLDEAYSSDCSNSNLGPIENSDSSNCIPEHFIKSPTQITSRNKINIISEEILSPSQLNELKSLHSPIVSDFIPVTVHTVISWDQKNDKFDNNVSATDSLCHKQDNARNALKINNIEGRNHSEDNIKLSIGLPVQIQAPNFCHENKYIDECNLLKEVQEISCTINKSMSQMSNEEVLNDNTKIELDNSDSNLGVCIDFEVMDLDKHLEENDEILEEFVNGITSNDSDEILEKLEQNEKICFNETKLPEMAVYGIKITDNFSIKGDEGIKEETHSKNESNSNITCVPLGVQSNIDEEMLIDTYDNLPNNFDESKLEGYVTINAKESALNTFDVKQLKERTGIKNDEKINLLQKSSRHDGELIENSEQFNNEFSLKQHYDLDVSNSKNSSEDSVTNMCDEKTNESNAIKNRTSDANVAIEKVEEIAMYLSQCLSSRRLKSKAMFPIRKEIIKQTKQNCLKSKLCIQGVEKPGGSKENVKNTKEVILKTYGRVNRSKKKIMLEQNETKLNDAVLQNKSGDLKLQPNSITLSYDCASKEFCLCHDFGSLTFYDCNSEYEHIHFWEHHNIDCDRDAIFSMYVEDYSMDLYNSNDTDMIPEINEDNPKVIGRSICWNNIRDDFIGETWREVPNNAAAGTADYLKNESIHYSQNLAGKITNENVENEDHPHENRSGYIPKVTVEINYEESEFDGLGFQTAGPNKTIQIDMENVDKTDVDDKIIQESPHIERRRSSKTTLNTIDKEPSKIIETSNNPIREETSDVHNESSKESSSLIGSRSNSNKNEKKNNSKRKRSSKMIEEEHRLDVLDNEPYSKKSIKCGVCEQFLSENEWEDHIGNEHCYIAWRQGRTRDSVDLNDSVLLKKLDQILTNNGELKCSFCEVKKKTVEKFLSHVRKCLKLKDSPNASVSCTSRNAETISEKLSLTSSNPEVISEELESISIDAKHGRNKNKLTSTNVKAREDKEIKSIKPEATGKSESTSSELIEAEIMTVNSHGKRKKSTNPEPFTESPESTSSVSELLSEEIKSPSVYSKANKKRKSQSTPKIQISQEQDPKSVSLSPELKREKLRSNTNSSKTISDKSKSLDAKMSTISKPISEELTSPPDDSKTAIKKRQFQSITKNLITQEQDPTSASLNPELKTVRHKLSSNASETISDKPKSIEAKAGSKNSKSKSPQSESFADSSKATSSISEPKREELKSTPVESKVTIKKSKLQLTPRTQICQEQDPKSASLSPEHKREKPKSTSNASESISDKPKSIGAKAGCKNRKSKSSNLEPFAESPKASSSISEPICEELKSPHVESKVTIKKSKLQSTPMTQTNQKQNPKSASLSAELKKEQLKSASTASETISDKLKSLDAKASCKHRKSKTSYLEPFAESPKASSSLSEPICEELKSPPVESKAIIGIKKRKLESTPMTQISQEQDPKSASLSSKLKKEQLKSTSETISDKLKSSHAKASSKNRKSKSINTESISEEPKSTSPTSERINKEPIATSIESMYKSKEKESNTINIKATGKRKPISTEPIIENLDNNSEATSKESQSRSPLQSMMKCGVCQQEVGNDCWIDHIAGHDYLAWEDGSTPLDLENEEEVRRHLNDLARQIGGLKCSKCGLTRKYLKTYLQHIVKCNGSENSPQAKSSDSESKLKVKIVKTPSQTKCAVCQKDLTDATWMEHISTEHNYLAWKDGETPLDLDDEEVVRQHLHTIAKQIGELICSKCGLTRRYAKSFLHHINDCEETVAHDDSVASETNDSQLNLESTSLQSSGNEDVKFPVTCGVCKKEISTVQWTLHIQKAHNYMAWKEGESLDINNAEEVQNHLYAISKVVGGLTCSKCGLLRKYVKAYLHHFENCAVTPPNYDETIDQTNKVPSCGVCSEKVVLKDWINHKMEKHYNIAWNSDEYPIDIKNPYAVERLLKEYKDIKKKLVCNVCGSSRVSCMGFYAHILTCGKSEEETKMFQNTCEICNKPYLCIYQNQHMAFHREQEYARERKLKEAEQKAVKLDVEVTIDSTSGRRKAAEKARTVIENYKTSSQFSHNCPNCGFGTDSRNEIDNHVCKKERDLNDSDASLHSEVSDDDSEESGVDSNVSEEEEQSQNIKKRIREYAPLPVKIPRLPFSVSNPSNYLVKCGTQLCKANSKTENLFVDWNRCQYEPVVDDQLVNYLPPLEESCKVKFGEDKWATYSRFEAKKSKGYSIFVGACIQCISWAPGVDDTCNKYLAVTCHPGADLPRYERDVTPLHSGLIQIWNFGDMTMLPEMALGIAHDYGTVWNMDWCPYGARDVLPTEDANATSRLGLLAVSCSNGHAYVFSVPYPSTIPLKNDKIIYKLKAVAELRLTMGSDRPIYQATSVRWSQQKDQSFVVVGYGDGTTAYFDLNSTSPLLKTKINDITIFYPYHDERPHNACVLGLSVFPSGEGAVCSASPTGAEAVMRPGLRPARLHSRVASSFTMFQPHWPAALLTGDDAIMSTAANELEWWGGGRRLGAVSACAGCAYCGRIATFQPPMLRLMRLHPAYAETRKQTIGSLQMMPIGKKRKVVTDELTTKLEPITYEEVIRKYGIEVKVNKNVQAPHTNKPRDQFPERFPLGDVRSMAFCPSFKHHGKLAVATHAGIIFLITI